MKTKQSEVSAVSKRNYNNLNAAKNDVRKYYWLKLQETFFERDEIKIIESMPNGKDYILFYMKLLLKAVHNNGRLMFKDTIPYTPEMLSTITNTNVDIVRVAVDTFIKLNLMDKLDDGALFMLEVSKMLGSETEYAQKKREYRENKAPGLLEDKSETNLDIVRPKKDKKRHCPTDIDIELEIEKDIPHNPPQVVDDGGWWLSCIKTNGYQFDSHEIQAIYYWVKYKLSRKEPILLQQMELTLKQLNQQRLAKQNIVYLIETSIARGYKEIMEPTKSSSSAAAISAPRLRYPAKEYITPEDKSQKIALRNYLERCYLRDKIDPRTKEVLTSEQSWVLNGHLANAQKLHVSFTDYVYREEVSTGKCLLDVRVA